MQAATNARISEPRAVQAAERPDHARLFGFEAAFVDTLRCVPMAVRFKLDRVGTKLSLRQWSRLSDIDRRTLLLEPCDAGEETASYCERVASLVFAATGQCAAPLAEPLDLSWRDADRTPDQVREFARSVGLDPLPAADWGGLTALQRYALVKLSRDNHDNVNFVPALREFGLTRGSSPSTIVTT